MNSNLAPEIPTEWGVTRPSDGAADLARLGVQVIERDVVNEARPTRHDSVKLGRALMETYARLRPAPAGKPSTLFRGMAGIFSPPPAAAASLQPLAALPPAEASPKR